MVQTSLGKKNCKRNLLLSSLFYGKETTLETKTSVNINLLGAQIKMKLQLRNLSCLTKAKAKAFVKAYETNYLDRSTAIARLIQI